ncbi:hypothetical protein B0F90DRAFT_1631821 [Multifurca ochricompacta]|uniref:DUF159-domain-containing protein n=1 Tax=Multifurca ochricompacta TaxID=376703 RepID=A0AAD4M204_9AGAM|nr:hypothetical protein B0F90DRAFT_1631821 [Multifurca ochricompacta]
MCGRFALALQADEVEQLNTYSYPAFRVNQWVHRDRYVPRYNVAPRTYAPVIRRAQPEEPALVMHSMKWGLVPHWSEAESPTLNTINARAENLEEGGGMWGGIKGKKRCVVVAQGYYEWLKKGTQRTPHFTRHRDRRLMLFAGLYDSATLNGEQRPLWTFAIVTTAASSGLAWLHDRQPVILTSQDALDQWLDTSSQTWNPKLNRLLDPYSDPDAPLECYAVPQEVGKVGTESPTFIEPVEKRKDGIEAMFMRQAEAMTATTKMQKSESGASTSSTFSNPPSMGSGKRKREPSESLETAEAVIAVSAASPTAKKRIKAESPLKGEVVDVDLINENDTSEGNSDIEILSPPSVRPFSFLLARKSDFFSLTLTLTLTLLTLTLTHTSTTRCHQSIKSVKGEDRG